MFGQETSHTLRISQGFLLKKLSNSLTRIYHGLYIYTAFYNRGWYNSHHFRRWFSGKRSRGFSRGISSHRKFQTKARCPGTVSSCRLEDFSCVGGWWLLEVYLKNMSLHEPRKNNKNTYTFRCIYIYIGCLIGILILIYLQSQYNSVEKLPYIPQTTELFHCSNDSQVSQHLMSSPENPWHFFALNLNNLQRRFMKLVQWTIHNRTPRAGEFKSSLTVNTSSFTPGVSFGGTIGRSKGPRICNRLLSISAEYFQNICLKPNSQAGILETNEQTNKLAK